MGRRHGINQDTYKHFVIDSGEVRKNYVDPTDLGVRMAATKGGSTFTIEQEIKEMVVDGAHGRVKGSRRITMVNAVLTVNFIEIYQDIIQKAIPGVNVADLPLIDPTHKSYSRGLVIEDADYLDNIVIVGEMSGSDEPIICGVKNALGDGSFELALVDKEEAGMAIQFSSHFDINTLDSEPWILEFPRDIATPTPAP